MSKRRPLIVGVSEIESDGIETETGEQLSSAEKSFVYGAESKSEEKEPSQMPAAQTQKEILPQMVGRTPITTRARPEVASALKRASLQRQLAGASPSSMQDIMEVALENWLKENGHLG